MAGVVALDPSALEIRPVVAGDVREFARWRYEEPYDVYDLTDPVEELVAYFTSPEIGCHVVTHDGVVVAFSTFGADGRVPGGDYSSAALDIGLGVRPDWTGRGLGAVVVAAVVGFARTLTDGRLRVTIAARNARALSVWRRSGFSEVSTFEAAGTHSVCTVPTSSGLAATRSRTW